MQFNSLYKVLRKRDFVVLVLIVIAFFLSLEGADFSYTLEPAWFLARGNSPSRWKPILPIVTDIDGDGRREVVVITNDFHLKVLSAERRHHGDGIYSPTELYSKVLTHSIADKNRLPVAMKVGYIDPYSSSHSRTQVVIVVLEDWTVICYDHLLNILWEKEVGHFSMDMENMHDIFKINEVSIYISPIDIVSDEEKTKTETETDGSSGESSESKISSNFGLVVIGASMGYRVDDQFGNHNISDSGDVADGFKGENAHDFMSVRTEHGLVMNEDGDIEHGDLTRKAQLGHFSLYALSARSGKVIWKHDGTELVAEQFTKSLPQHSLLNGDRLTYESRKDLALQAHHTTRNNDWTMYKTSLLGELPHDWHQREDTTLGLSYFTRKHVGTGSDVQASRPNHSRKRPVSIKSAAVTRDKRTGGDATGTGTAGTAGTTAGLSSKRLDKGGGHKSTLKRRHGFERWFSGLHMPAVPDHAHLHDRSRDGQQHSNDLHRVGAGGDKSAGYVGAVLPHDAIEHVEHPNVVVAHTKHGLDVVSLARGTPITSLTLTQGATYSDLNGDGIVDSIILLEDEKSVTAHGVAFAHGGGELLPCTMMVVSGLPPKAQLFNASVCLDRSSLHDPASLAYRTERKQVVAQRKAGVRAASPLVLRRMHPRAQTIEDKVKDIVVAINSGIVTSYAGDGTFNWQTRGAPAWKMDFDFPCVSSYDYDFYRAEEHYVGHMNHPFSMILVSGQFSVSVLNRDGEILTTADIPKYPIASSVLSDFDNDGITDVIITTENAVLGYKMHINVTTPVVFILLCVLTAFAFLAFITNIKSVVVLPPVQMQRANVNTNARRMYSLRRSTDDEHND